MVSVSKSSFDSIRSVHGTERTTNDGSFITSMICYSGFHFNVSGTEKKLERGLTDKVEVLDLERNRATPEDAAL